MTFITAILSGVRSFISFMNLMADVVSRLLLVLPLLCIALVCFCFSALLFWDLAKLLLEQLLALF